MLEDLKDEDIQTSYFQFLALLIQDVISRNSRTQSTNLKIACAYLQNQHMKNVFKAIFEIFTCE